jgi:secondary thiamine-phosphate synthase enzyme
MTRREKRMDPVSIHCDSLEVSLGKGPDVADITPALQHIVQESGIAAGTLSAAMIGSTGSLTTIEFESGAVADLKQAVNRLAPPGERYAHELAWHDGNGHSHVQAALMGPSISLPVRAGKLRLGTGQQAVAINHDNGARIRKIEVTVIGVR